ncbi:MAG: hypothetical protein U0K54_05680 [Acutalibacteraceae bacterium]|nr:hypothetical protein [Acutalibacteraceae bacterium]
MKKIFSIVLSLSIILACSGFASAATISNPLKNLPVSVISNDASATVSVKDYISNNSDNKITMVEKSSFDDEILEKLKSDFENSKVIVFYGDKEDNLDPLFALNTLGLGQDMNVSYEDDIAKENAKNIIASAAYIDENNNIHTMAYFDLSDEGAKTVQSDIVNIAETYLDYSERVSNRFSTHNIETNAQSRASTPYDDYSNVIKEFTFDWGKYGSMQSTSCFTRVGYSSSQSVWDLYGANFFKVKSPYGAQEVYTRYSVEGIANERVVDHGPTSITSGGTATVGLDTAGPSISWSQDLSGIYLDDLYSPPDYARWKYTYTIAQSDENMTFNPGARFTNTSGQFICDVSHSYRCIKTGFLGIGSEDKTLYTGTYRYYFNDR